MEKLKYVAFVTFVAANLISILDGILWIPQHPLFETKSPKVIQKEHLTTNQNHKKMTLFDTDDTEFVTHQTIGEKIIELTHKKGYRIGFQARLHDMYFDWSNEYTTYHNLFTAVFDADKRIRVYIPQGTSGKILKHQNPILKIEGKIKRFKPLIIESTAVKIVEE